MNITKREIILLIGALLCTISLVRAEIIWKMQNSGLGSGYLLNSIAFSGSRYVVAGDGRFSPSKGVIISSADGAIWEKSWSAQPNIPGGIQSAAYGNGIFVAAGWIKRTNSQLGQYGFLLTSTDGMSWSEVNASNQNDINSSGPFMGLAFGGGKFVAISLNNIFASNDGKTWAKVSPQNWSQIWSSDFCSIAWNGKQFVCVGADQGKAGAIATSPDGIVWTQVKTLVYDTPLQSICWTGTKWVSVGGRWGVGSNSFGTGAYDTATVAISADGIAWDFARKKIPGGLRSVCWSGTELVAIGSGNKTYTSTDGDQWTLVTSAGSDGNTASLFSIASIPTGFLAVGMDGMILRTGPINTKIVPYSAKRYLPLLPFDYISPRDALGRTLFTEINESSKHPITTWYCEYPPSDRKK